jgi:ribonuclease HI
VTSLRLFTDGGARGNPGPAAAAYVITDESGHRVAAHAECIGETTNNEAEYRALLLGLRAARTLGTQELHWASDSQLVVRQMTGEYKVQNERLRALNQAAWEAAEGITLVPEHRPRTDSAIAAVDGMVNAALDECT